VQRSSGNASLDAAALKAVRGWAFMPASRNGQNIASIVQVPVNFRLN
jgi:protein TonB